MAQFCSKCGSMVGDGATFCPNCGNPIAIQFVQPVQPVQPIQYYIKPKIPGRGFGISSMVLGIIGLFYAVCFFAMFLDMPMSFVGSAIPSILVFTVMPILAVCFGAAARNRGYNNGVCKSGLTMGVIGLCLYAIILLSALANM